MPAVRWCEKKKPAFSPASAQLQSVPVRRIAERKNCTQMQNIEECPPPQIQRMNKSNKGQALKAPLARCWGRTGRSLAVYPRCLFEKQFCFSSGHFCTCQELRLTQGVCLTLQPRGVSVQLLRWLTSVDVWSLVFERGSRGRKRKRPGWWWTSCSQRAECGNH